MRTLRRLAAIVAFVTALTLAGGVAAARAMAEPGESAVLRQPGIAAATTRLDVPVARSAHDGRTGHGDVTGAFFGNQRIAAAGRPASAAPGVTGWVPDPAVPRGGG